MLLQASRRAGDLKALLVNSFTRGGSDLSTFARGVAMPKRQRTKQGIARTVAALAEALRAPSAAAMCARADRRMNWS